MIIKVYIEGKSYDIDCDIGTQDIAWLAISACYCHGLDTYPVSRYIPCLATNKHNEILHPKLVLSKYGSIIGDEVTVKIRPPLTDLINGELTKEEVKWCDQAFGKERFMMEVKIKYTFI